MGELGKVDYSQYSIYFSMDSKPKDTSFPIFPFLLLYIQVSFLSSVVIYLIFFEYSKFLKIYEISSALRYGTHDYFLQDERREQKVQIYGDLGVVSLKKNWDII